MSKTNVKITGSLKDRVQALLGGSNPTPKRLESLLDELEERRQVDKAPGLDDRGPEDPMVATPSPDFMAGKRAAEPFPPLFEPGDTIAAVALERDPAPDREPESEPEPKQQHLHDDDIRLAESVEVKLLREQNQLLMRHLEAIEKKLDTIVVKPEDAREGASLLPPAGSMAPPLGLTGPASWPKGEWFSSPLGPRVPHKVCDCHRCSTGVLHHWFCNVCRSGPHHYQVVCREHGEGQRNPTYIKNHFAPGGIWGISHNACSPLCYMQYLSQMGVIAGVNDAEPRSMPPAPGQPSEIEDVRRPLDSD